MTSASTQLVHSTSIATTTRWLLGRVFMRLRWFLGILVVSLVLAYVFFASAATDVLSLWEITGSNAPRWFLFAMGIMLVTVYLPPLVAAGVTRARVASAAALALLGASVALALVAPAGFLFEAAYSKASDLKPVLQFGHLFSSPTQAPLVFAEALLTGTLHAYMGLLVGFSFYRGGWLVGLLLLPVTVGVPAAIGYLLVDLGGSALSWLPTMEPGTRAGLLALLVIAVYAAVRWLLPTTPLRTNTP